MLEDTVNNEIHFPLEWINSIPRMFSIGGEIL